MEKKPIVTNNNKSVGDVGKYVGILKEPESLSGLDTESLYRRLNDPSV